VAQQNRHQRGEPGEVVLGTAVASILCSHVLLMRKLDKLIVLNGAPPGPKEEKKLERLYSAAVQHSDLRHDRQRQDHVRASLPAERVGRVPVVFDDLGQIAARLAVRQANTAAELEAALSSRWVVFNPHRMFPGDASGAFGSLPVVLRLLERGGQESVPGD